MSEPALEARDVHLSYGDTPVLDGISIVVGKGELLALVGSNGAGKTTLLRVLSGVVRPQSGKVLAAGSDIRQLTPKLRARLIAMVPQNPSLARGFSVLEVVLMGRNPHLGLLQWEGANDLHVSMRALELTGVDALAGKPIETLSGGERQRVFIARALAQETPILLLDEPTTHLDIGYQAGILDLIARIRQEAGHTVVAAMHDLSLAAQYFDRIAMLHESRVFALGTPGEVVTKEIVSTAFGADVTVVPHPVHGTPMAIPVGHGGGRMR
jgi:iron complex transport system ATP-binding protein